MTRTDHGFPGIYNATPITLSNGEGSALATDVNGNIKVNLASGSSISQGTYNLTPPTLSDTGVSSIQLDVNGNEKVVEQYAAQAEDNANGVYAEAIKPLATSTYSWSLFQNLGANATLNVKATAGNVKSIYCHNVSGAARFIQIHNTATTPGGGAVPKLTFFVPIGGTTIIDGAFLGENGYNFATGIAFACSTTEATYTAATATDHITQIMYF